MPTVQSRLLMRRAIQSMAARSEGAWSRPSLPCRTRLFVLPVSMFPSAVPPLGGKGGVVVVK